MVQDFAYAEDALSLWNAIATYVRDTLVRNSAREHRANLSWVAGISHSKDRALSLAVDAT